MENWERVFREGFSPNMTTDELRALAEGLANDDKRIVQGATTLPVPLLCVHDWPVECGCPIAFAGWIGGNLTNVGEVEERFAQLCHACDATMGEHSACRYFLNFWDETPRHEAFTKLHGVVDDLLMDRAIDEANAVINYIMDEAGTPVYDGPLAVESDE